MLSCQHIAEYATDYVEGRMNFWQRLKFRMHLRACVHCERFIRHMGLTCILSGRCAHQLATQEEVEAVLERIKSSQ
jgi:hypothetical protein